MTTDELFDGAVTNLRQSADKLLAVAADRSHLNEGNPDVKNAITAFNEQLKECFMVKNVCNNHDPEFCIPYHPTLNPPPKSA